MFVFDCLFINGRSLLKTPLRERREALHGALIEVEGEMQVAVAKTSRDLEELQASRHSRSGTTVLTHSFMLSSSNEIIILFHL